MAYKRKIGKTLIKGAVVFAAVNAAVGAVIAHSKKKIKESTTNVDDLEKHFDVIMQGRQIKLTDEEFQKVKINTIMGGVDLDLRSSKITEDVFIKCKSYMGGVNIRVPEGVNVVIHGKSIMGGITNFVPVIDGEDIPTVYIKANQVMGGLCVKQGVPDVEDEELDDTDGENKEKVNVEEGNQEVKQKEEVKIDSENGDSEEKTSENETSDE